ncbi:non-ribosomal peptide synthetase [Zooshikella harenae]|uniref:Amino acid adenylation domain-containing protein n=1 Tax=Zooshikella harenae TaxID=2827238 RepID=A0ABS5ZCW9_9GAMM|nr:non-ribosomal peptide synthetase [Zooshikella harenae]MBU2711120.1 amino acid adenylation domain-containing protein [Zooshikella harenae]
MKSTEAATVLPNTNTLQKTEEDWQPLTRAQAGIWYAQQRFPQSVVYNTGEYLDIRGQLNLDFFQQAIKQAVMEADSLHCRFQLVDGELQQEIDPCRPIEVAIIDCSCAADPVADALQWMQNDVSRPMDLQQGPLVRQAIIKVFPDRNFWYQGIHHIAIDGYGFSLLIARVAEIYRALVTSSAVKPCTFQPLSTLLKEDQDYWQSAKCQQDKHYWLQQFATLPEPSSLSVRRYSAAAQSQALRQQVTLNDELVTHLKAISQQADINWQFMFYAAVAGFQQRMTHTEELVLGVPMMGRFGSVSLRTPTMQVNVIPLRISLTAETSLSELMNTVAKQFMGASRHQRYRFEAIQHDLGLIQQGRPLFNTLVNVLPFDGDSDFLGDAATLHNLAAGPVDDLSIYLFVRDGHFQLVLEGNPSCYSDADLALLLRRFQRFLQNWCRADLSQPLASLGMLLPGEFDLLINGFNQTAHKVPETTLTTLLQAQASASPSNTAVVFENQTLSYQALSVRANQLAHYLIQQGVGPGKFVGLAIPRSLELIVAQQAIIRAGGAYLPIDPDYPADRISYMQDHAQPVLILTCQLLAGLFGFPCIYVDDLLHEGVNNPWRSLPSHWPLVSEMLQPLQATDPAYVIYTSGSTGKPKGVVVSHRAIVNRLLWMQGQYLIGSGTQVLQKTPSSFDVSVWEFFWPLMTGATLVVASPDLHKDPQGLALLIQQQAIHVMHFVPSMLQAFVDCPEAQKCTSLQKVMCSGEALPHEAIAQFYQCLPQATLYNLYGPTEAAVDVTYWDCPQQQHSSAVPIGKPIWNTRLYVLDRQLQPTPIGVKGELYIAGRNLAEGYLNQRELTAERFVPDPFVENGERMYRTGDLASWNPQGELEYFGRMDQQVKLRGLRIELGEIEAVMAQHPLVAQAAVVIKYSPSNEPMLVGYVVPTLSVETDLGELIASIRNQLINQVPEYMVPPIISSLSALPLSPSGKLDRKQLPDPEFSVQALKDAPASFKEQQLVTVMAEVLGVSTVGPQDNFFALGGNSLSVVKLINRLQQVLGINIPLGTVFAKPTAKGLLSALADNKPLNDGLEMLLPLRMQGPERPLFAIHPAGGLCWCYSGLLPHLPADTPMYGLQAPLLSATEGHQHERSLAAMASDYLSMIKKIQPEGPYQLIGWSFGGMLAHELATQLQQQGKEVALLALVDAYPSDQWRDMPAVGEQEALQALLRIAGYEPETGFPDDLTPTQTRTLLKQQGSALASLSETTWQAITQVVIENSYLVRSSNHPVFKGDIVFFQATGPRPEINVDYSGWQPYVTGQLYCHDIPCTHGMMLQPPMVDLIGKTLKKCLQGSDAV